MTNSASLDALGLPRGIALSREGGSRAPRPWTPIRVTMRPYSAADVDELLQYTRFPGAREHLLEFARLPPRWNWTVLGDGAIMGAGGVVQKWAGVATAWAFVKYVPRRAWPKVTNIVRAVLDDALDGHFQRLETTVQADFPAGLRWALRLGFAYEGTIPRYFEGRTHWILGRVV